MGEKEKNEAANGSEKGGSVIPALVLGIVGLGIGIAVGMFLPKGSNPVTGNGEPECAKEVSETISRTEMSGEQRSEINAKLDAFEKSGPLGARYLKPFYWKQLGADARMQTVFTFLKNEDLADYVAAQESWNGGDPIVKTVPASRIKEIHKMIFGEEPSEEDFVSYVTCSSVPGKFDYDAENSQYKITYAAGCGGYIVEPMDSYRDIYEVKGDVAYVTVELGAVENDGNKSYVTDDYLKGTVISEYDYNNSDFVNETTKDKFKKYQFIFDKKDGNWVMRGLYPLGVE